VRWFALHLRSLPLEALGGRDALMAGAPAAVLEARRVVSANPAAQALGVGVGMSLAAASSWAPTMQTWPRQPADEAALMRRLAMALSRYTPSVVLQPDGLLLEVQASLRLFGGARALAAAMRTTACDSGVQDIGFAAAPTALGAALLARMTAGSSTGLSTGLSATHAASPNHHGTSHLERRLDALPLDAVLAHVPALLAAQASPTASHGASTAHHGASTAPMTRLATLLHGMGCRTLADVRALPRTGLMQRGGADLLDFIDRAYGHAPDPQRWYDPPAQFEQKIDLLHRADTAQAVVFAAQRLVQPLAGWLTQQWLAATRLSLHLQHETERRRVRPDTPLVLVLSEPTRDAASLLLLLRERLQRLALPAPVYALRLKLDEAQDHAGREATFWPSAQAQRQSERALLDRLSARLGPERVSRAQAQADHRPEHAQRWVPATDPAPRTDVVKPHAQRPSWLLRQPLPLAEVNHRPVHEGAALLVVSEAERIEAGWFDHDWVRRDYHVAVSLRDRRCFWIYREPALARDAESVATASSRWFLHGIFG
jgi:protein ImuB